MNLWYNLPGVYMEHLVFKILKAKEAFTTEDFHMLIVLCEKLFKRNEDISLELGKSLENIDRLTKRVDFYRNATMRGVK